jgi:tRNA(Ile)-lysidine synthase
MAPATLYGWKTWIARPLLSTRREALRDFLRGRGVGWAEDPTNADHDFERPRIRAAMSARPQAGAFTQTLALAADAATQREAVARRAALLVSAHASQPAPGLLRLDPGFATVADRPAAIEALRLLLATAGGVAFAPDDARTAALFDQIARGGGRATLARTVVDARRSGIFILREIRDHPQPLPPVDGMVWDGRRQINFHDAPGMSVIAPLGIEAAAKSPVTENDAPPSLVRAALAAEPALWLDGECLGALALNAGDNAVFPVVAPFARFLTAFDLPLAVALGALVGAPPLPPSPLPASPAAGTRQQSQDKGLCLARKGTLPMIAASFLSTYASSGGPNGTPDESELS